MSEYLEIPREFLEEEQKLCQTMPKLHSSGRTNTKFGPQPSHQKKTRRDKVYKLHFEYGYSARKIATMIKANRNTVNSDISFWYGQMQKDDDKTSRLNQLFQPVEFVYLQRARFADESWTMAVKIFLYSLSSHLTS